MLAKRSLLLLSNAFRSASTSAFARGKGSGIAGARASAATAAGATPGARPGGGLGAAGGANPGAAQPASAGGQAVEGKAVTDAPAAPHGQPGIGKGSAAGGQHAASGQRSRAADLPVYAALDLGTNNCRLLVAIPQRPGQFRVIDAFSRIVRLGEGLSASGRLGQPAMDRAVEALRSLVIDLAWKCPRFSVLSAEEGGISRPSQLRDDSHPWEPQDSRKN